ncbi:MAG: cyclic nucleotide-binding domain-containing protein [Nitrospina sp.]|jgi:CRP/FNR family transcriptional regulator|nr:cyclic nucleotide-binding domain-containing protein [Nitrospina sp.]MBT3510721.1 cyclic nucleotide-binding domain-containing protein [Nitrospina sp.]MBT3875990.1 cyclic nucleotide-binding domain-containing protein [Nitrospina sp.]MBT4048967.1 cyclic nucleotide-binding domain-containing protein [Nitrospina sp.]MBT4557645.1 cyclic nucleotide-binding domain-containing protein [Nitrospina sp.]
MNEKKVYTKGALIIREGSVQRDAYLIEKGRVQVFRQDENGNKAVIAVCGKQEVIGEMTLLKGGSRCANVVALEDCELSVLSFNVFKDLPDSDPGVRILRKIMDERIKSATPSA